MSRIAFRQAEDSAVSAVNAKVAWRLIPFLSLCYLFSYLDRVNLGFAALTMNQDLALTHTAFAVGAGMFFIGYFIFEVPSNFAMERVGARLWIARILISWGLLSSLTGFVWNSNSFLVARFLLGAAEAGFVPGVMYYLTLWVPPVQRARLMAAWCVAIPISIVFGGPVSGVIMTRLDGAWQMAGWRWLFLLEGLPTIFLGVAAFFYLTDRPQFASWLSPGERTILLAQLGANAAPPRASAHGFMAALREPKVLILGVAGIGYAMSSYGLVVWLPQVMKEFDLVNLAIGWLSAIPFAVAAVAMVLWGSHSDRTNERRWHVALPCFLTAVSLVGGAISHNALFSFVWLNLMAVGVYCVIATFWSLPPGFLSGSAAAGGIAMMNSIVNLGGFAGPYAIGALKDKTGSFGPGMFVLAGCITVLGIVVLVVLRPARVAAGYGSGPA
jgi:ACS family tartrate transporter-like MFS transporter